MFLKATDVFAVIGLITAVALATDLHGDVVYKDLYTYARQQRSDLISIDYDIQRALQEENIALSGLFPAAHISANKQGQRGDVWPNQQITLSLQTSIYEPAGPMAQWWLAQTITDLTRFTKEDQIDNVHYEVGQTFFSYRNTLHKNHLIDSMNQSSRERFAKAEVDLTVGLVSPVEFEKERALFETAQSRVKEYINEVSIAKENLAYATERPITGPLHNFSSDLLYNHILEVLHPFSPDQFVTEALSSRKELKVIDQRIAATKIKKDIARYSYIPTIKFLVDLSRLSAPDILAIVSTAPYRFGLEFNWDFDLGNLFRFRSAGAEELREVFNRKRTEFTIENEVRTTCDQLEIVAKEVVAVRAKLDEARITFERNERSYNVGIISEVEFKNAQTEWEQAQFNLEDIITKAAQKHEELLWSTGYPKEQVSCFDLIEKRL